MEAEGTKEAAQAAEALHEEKLRLPLPDRVRPLIRAEKATDL